MWGLVWLGAFLGLGAATIWWLGTDERKDGWIWALYPGWSLWLVFTASWIGQ